MVRRTRWVVPGVLVAALWAVPATAEEPKMSAFVGVMPLAGASNRGVGFLGGISRTIKPMTSAALQAIVEADVVPKYNHRSLFGAGGGIRYLMTSNPKRQMFLQFLAGFLHGGKSDDDPDPDNVPRTGFAGRISAGLTLPAGNRLAVGIELGYGFAKASTKTSKALAIAVSLVFPLGSQ